MIYWQPGMTIDQLEKQVIRKALVYFQGNKTKTADSLGIAIRTLDNKIEKYQEEEDAFQRRSVEASRNQFEMLQRQQGKSVGVQTESTLETPAQQPMPVQQREEIQKMPPTSSARTNQRR